MHAYTKQTDRQTGPFDCAAHLLVFAAVQHLQVVLPVRRVAEALPQPQRCRVLGGLATRRRARALAVLRGKLLLAED